MALRAICDGCEKEISLKSEIGLLKAGTVHHDMICEEISGNRLIICESCLEKISTAIGLDLTLMKRMK